MGQAAHPRRLLKETGSLYFAYGSNLHMQQMAQRCPDSIFKGKATLTGYRWQINQRGVANVVASRNDVVEGLLYLVNIRDEKSLDRSEGVAKGFYQKHLLKVTLEPSTRYFNFASSDTAEQLVHLQSFEGQGNHVLETQSPFDATSQLPNRIEEPTARSQKVKALVYVSENYTADGSIREEYIPRMQRAVSDAVKLGVSQSFLEKYVFPFLHQQNAMPSSSASPGVRHRGSAVTKQKGAAEKTKKPHVEASYTSSDEICEQHPIHIKINKYHDLFLHESNTFLCY